jgi:hypothetical protein
VATTIETGQAISLMVASVSGEQFSRWSVETAGRGTVEGKDVALTQASIRRCFPGGRGDHLRDRTRMTLVERSR